METTAKRQPLSRAKVAEAALSLVDREGLDQLSMRKLAASLGVEAMSLYNHVRSKDDLENELSEFLNAKVLAEYQSSVGPTWQERARAMALAYFKVGMAHPNAFSLLSEHPASRHADVLVLSECVRVFLDAGLTVEEASSGFHAAAAWVVGAVEQELRLMSRIRAGEGFKDAQLPSELAFLPAFRDQCIGHTPEERFTAGLDIIMVGLESFVAQRTTG